MSDRLVRFAGDSWQEIKALPQQVRWTVGFSAHSEPPTNWSDENAVIQQLSRMAGGSLRIKAYCAGQLGVGPVLSRGGVGAPGSSGQTTRAEG